MFGNFAKLDSPRRLVQFWQNFQTSLVLLIPNCTRQRMITYTNSDINLPFEPVIMLILFFLNLTQKAPVIYLNFVFEVFESP